MGCVCLCSGAAGSIQRVISSSPETGDHKRYKTLKMQLSEGESLLSLGMSRMVIRFNLLDLVVLQLPPSGPLVPDVPVCGPDGEDDQPGGSALRILH